VLACERKHGAEDVIAFGLDPRHDHLNAYMFRVNASGVQADQSYFDDTSSSSDYDGVWEVSTVVTALGWDAELRIPFSQMRFSLAPGNQAVWGLQVRREMAVRGEHNVGHLPSGDFTQTLFGNRLRVNVSPDLSIASYVQYDTDSDSIGVNTRLRWTFTPVADLFVVYNHNVRSLLERWQLQSNQLLIKLQYAWRM